MIELVKQVVIQAKPKSLAIKNPRDLHLESPNAKQLMARSSLSPLRDNLRSLDPESIISRKGSKQVERVYDSKQYLDIEKQRRLIRELEETKKQEGTLKKRGGSQPRTRPNSLSRTSKEGEGQKSLISQSRTNRMQNITHKEVETQHMNRGLLLPQRTDLVPRTDLQVEASFLRKSVTPVRDRAHSNSGLGSSSKTKNEFYTMYKH